MQTRKVVEIEIFPEKNTIEIDEQAQFLSVQTNMGRIFLYVSLPVRTAKQAKKWTATHHINVLRNGMEYANGDKFLFTVQRTYEGSSMGIARLIETTVYHIFYTGCTDKESDRIAAALAWR